MMWKILRGGATVIPGATFIPESRVHGSTQYVQGAQLWLAKSFYMSPAVISISAKNN